MHSFSLWLFRMRNTLLMAVLLCGFLVLPCSGQKATSELTPMVPVPAEAQVDSSGHLDVQAATRAYLDEIPADNKAAFDRYFEGKYWLILWDALYTIAVLLILLFSGLSAKMRDLAERVTRFYGCIHGVYFAEFSLVTFVLGLPLIGR